MSLTILECNHKNAVGGGTNAKWENVFQNPVEVGTGDVLELHTAILDTSNYNSSFIEIENDVDLDLEFGYYIINYTDTLRAMMNKDDQQISFEVDYEAYIARGNAPMATGLSDHITGTFTKTLKAGVYSPLLLAEELTRLMSEIPLEWPLPESVEKSNPFMLWDDESYFYVRDDVDVNSTTQNYILLEGTESQDYGWMVGASQVGVVFNKNANAKFEIEYLHTPFMYDNKPSISIKGLTVDGDFSRRICNAWAGVFFTKLEPKSFWEDILGFDVDSILYSFDDNKKLSHRIIDEQGTKTTGGFVGVSNWIKPVTKGENTMKVSNEIIVAIGDIETKGIIAANEYEPSVGGGFYLLSCSNFVNDYREDEKKRIDIQGIISQQYVQNNFTISLSDAGISYENLGDPFLLSRMQIEILEGNSKTPLTTLGSNSCVFFKLIKK